MCDKKIGYGCAGLPRDYPAHLRARAQGKLNTVASQAMLAVNLGQTTQIVCQRTMLPIIVQKIRDRSGQCRFEAFRYDETEESFFVGMERVIWFDVTDER